MALDPVKNFAKVTVSIGYDASATSIALTAGHGARLPAPSTDGSFNLVWWNVTDYSDPTDDPNVEIVRCTARSTDTLTVTRAQESTSASTKNTSSKTYKMILAPTAKTITDITSGTETFSNKTINTADTNTIKINGNTLSATAGTATVTVPNSTDTLVGRATTDTLTNKSINGSNNTITIISLSASVTSNLPVANLNNGTGASATTFWRGDATWATPAGASSDKSVRVTKSGNQSGLTAGADNTVTWDTEAFDTDTMHDNVTNNSRITFTTSGKYLVIANINYTTNSVMSVKIRLNGTTVISRNSQGNGGVTEGINTQVLYNFSASDYVEVLFNPVSGTSDINTDSHFEAIKLA